jgi:hypothetical protein
MTRPSITWPVAATLAVIAVAVTAVPLSAIIIIDGHTGLFGVTPDQTIRVSIFNAAMKGGIHPCVKVFDITGALLAERDGQSIRPGEGTVVDFDGAALGPRAATRAQVRIEVEFETPPPDDNSPPPDDQVSAGVRRGTNILTLEVFDNDTGKTAFTVPWHLKGFNPQPEPPARH